jgi:transposase
MVVETAKRQDRIRRLHDLAKEVRAVAEAMHDLRYKRSMVLIAESYDHMANKLEFLWQHLSLPEEPSPGLSPESETSTVAEPK